MRANRIATPLQAHLIYKLASFLRFQQRILLSLRTNNWTTQIAKFMGPTWDPPGSCRPQMGPMLAPRTLLSGYCYNGIIAHRSRQLILQENGTNARFQPFHIVNQKCTIIFVEWFSLIHRRRVTLTCLSTKPSLNIDHLWHICVFSA